IRCPSRVPGLILTSNGSVRSTVPSPWQVGQEEMFFPVPWQRGHCTLNFIRPPVCSIVPLPWHCGHVPVASTNPFPLHVAQVSRCAMLSFITPPRIAVQNGTLTWYSRSVPGSGPSSAATPAPPRSKILEKISRKPPPPAELAEVFLPRPPPSNRSEKSNPPKSKCTPPAPAEPVAPCCPPGNPPGAPPCR